MYLQTKKTTIYILLAKIMLYLIFALQKIFGPHYLKPKTLRYHVTANIYEMA